MKTLLLILLHVGMIACGTAGAQGLTGFFTQQETKQKLMLEQIAGIETFRQELKTGYRDTQNGLAVAHSLKGGTMDLHADYFSSLSAVNPVVGNDPKVQAILSFQQQAAALFNAELSWQRQQGILTGRELSYLQTVAANLQAGCAKDVGELSAVTTPGKLQLKDEERIKRIDALYEDMKDKYAFARYFTGNARAMAAARKEERGHNKNLQKLYNINP